MEPQALAFVRERHAYADGDYQRVRNQQEFLRAIIKKSIAGQTLSNPITINNMVGAVSPFVTVDKTLDSGAVAGLGLELKDIRAQNTVMFTLPTSGVGTSADGQSIVLTDPNAIQGHFRGDGLGHPGRVRRGEQVRERELSPPSEAPEEALGPLARGGRSGSVRSWGTIRSQPTRLPRRPRPSPHPPRRAAVVRCMMLLGALLAVRRWPSRRTSSPGRGPGAPLRPEMRCRPRPRLPRTATGTEPHALADAQPHAHAGTTRRRPQHLADRERQPGE